MQVKETTIGLFPVEQLQGKDWKPIMDLAISAIKGFQWQLGFGTLLGIVRDDNVIPHDIDLDIDILIPKSDKNIQEQLRNIKNELESKECSFIKTQEYGDKLMSLALLHKPTRIVIDYCIFYNEWGTDYLHIGTEGIVIRPKSSITTKTKMGYNIPKNYDEYLTGRYGDWRVPCSSKKAWHSDASLGNLFIPLKCKHQ